MTPSPTKVRDIFLAALKLAPAQWDAYLADVCRDDPALRERVQNLLVAHGEAGSFLEPAIAGQSITTDQLFAERSGDVIGPYKLLEQIGEGGFGLVYMAEQIQPVRRKVALKILKPGMDTKQVVMRFEAERQALAIMDHPSIAKVYDGGTTPSGRPYFVMELVKGAPITEFCDEQKLSPRQRLELFLQVCQAVQHAHHKGIIHRDLKPSNILVVMHDTTPVPKVIDFGVAKALGQELTDRTLFTGFAQMVGTPLYMSPEQAGQSGLDIDTRSDVYSLGVLLYELLTGTTPFEKERFKKAAYEEIRRIIREEEPPRPSTRLSASKESLASISAQRHTEPAKLTKLVRGELDWIVMKALEKDRNRRYETANSFAQDLQRYLADEPVQACPPSAWYRVAKFVRRNKAPVIAASLVFLALVAGVIGTSFGLVRALDAEQAARTAEDHERQAKQVAEKNLEQALRAADTFFTRVSESKLLDKPALQPFRKELLEEAQKQYLELFNKNPNHPKLKAELAASYLRMVIVLAALGNSRELKAVQALEKGLDLIEPLLKERLGDRELVERLTGVWAAERTMFGPWSGPLTGSELPNAVKTLERACDLWKKLVDDYPDLPELGGDYATLLMYQGDVYFGQERYRDAQRLYEASDAEFSRVVRVSTLSCEQRIQATYARLWVAFHLSWFGHFGEAVAKYAEALKMFGDLEREFPNKSIVPFSALAGQIDMVEMLKYMSRQQEAEAMEKRMFEIAEKLHAQQPDVPAYAIFLVCAYGDRIADEESKGRILAAEAMLRKSVNAIEKAAEHYPEHPDVEAFLASQYGSLAMFRQRRGDSQQALRLTEQAVATLQRLGADAADERAVLQQFGALYSQLAGINRTLARPADAEKAYRAAIEKQSRLLQKYHTSTFYTTDLHGSCAGLVDLLRSTGRSREADDFIRQTVVAWEKRARADSEKYEFQFQVAQSYALAGKWDGAAQEYSKAIDKWPHRIDLWRGRAVAYSNSGKHDLAVQDYTTLLEFGYRCYAMHIWMYDARAGAYRALKQDDKALADLTRATQQWPFMVNPWMSRGNLYRDLGLWDNAIGDYSQALKVKPEHLPAWQARGLAYARMKEWDKAAADLQKVYDHPSNDPSHRDLVARTHFDCGVLQDAHRRKSDAIENYRKAVAIWLKLAEDPFNGRPYREHAVNALLWRLGLALQANGRTTEAEQTFTQAVNECEELANVLPIKPENRVCLGYAYSFRAQTLVSLGKRQEAEQLLARAVERWSDNDYVWMARAWLHERLQQPDKARADFEKAFEAVEAAIKKWPDSGYVWRARGQVHVALQRPAQALADFSKAIEVAPRLDAWIYRDRALARIALKQEELALIDLSKAVDQWPDMWDARVWRADFHRDRGQWDKAIDDYSKAIQLNANLWEVWHHRGIAYAGLKEWAKAIDDQTKAIELSPTPHLWSWRQRGMSHVQLKNWDAALCDFTKVVELDPNQARDLVAHFQAVQRNLEAAKLLRRSIEVVERKTVDSSSTTDLPDLGRSWQLLAQLLEKNGRQKDSEAAWNRAIDIFAKLAKEQPATASHRDLLARCHHDLGVQQRQYGQTDAAERNLRQAAEAWTKLAADVPTEPAYLVHAVNAFLYPWASLLQESGRTAEAEQFVARAFPEWLKLARDDREDHRNALADAMGLRSRLLFELGKHQQAEQLTTKMVQQWPGNAHALIARGRMRLALRQPANALEDFDKAIALAPKDGMAPWWHLDRSNAYAALKQDDKALATLTDATKRWPGLWDAWMWRANFHFNRQRWIEAVADYTQGLALNREYAPAWHHRGLAAARLADWDQAVEAYSKAITLRPKDANLHHELAWLLAHCPDEKIRDPKRAVELARRAVERQPKNGAYRGALGAALYRAGDPKAAIEELKTSLKLRRSHGADMLFLAMAHQRLDQDADARTWYARATEWIEKHAPQDDELRRFQEEAAKALGIEKKKDRQESAVGNQESEAEVNLPSDC